MRNFIKKSFALVLVLIIALSVNMTAFAAVSPTSQNTYAGQKIDVKFQYKGIAGIEGKFTYSNPDLFSNVKFSISGLTLGKYNESKKTIAYLGSDPVNCTITLTLTVAQNAKIGDNCKITFQYETTVDGNMPSKHDYKYDTVTVNIVEKLDLSSLKSAIEKAEGLKKSAYTTETWSKLETALSSAKKALSSATTQKEVNSATDGLNAAIKGLEKLPDYYELLKQIKIAEALNKSDYTTDTWATLESALGAAKNAKNSKIQSEIDSAAKTLKNAIAGLKTIYDGKLKLDELNEQIAIAEKLDANDYAVEGWEEMTKALKTAKEATSSKLQPEIDAAASELKDAISKLVKIDYSRLSAIISAITDFMNKNQTLFDLLDKTPGLISEANSALTSRNQQTVDECTAKLEDLLEQLRKALEEIGNSGSIIVEKPVEVQPDKYCNVTSHRIWIILFWISFAINLGCGIMIFLYFKTKKKMATDDTPLVDYDITDDYKEDN